MDEAPAAAGRLGEFVIDSRFCGPPESGNGGYTCGRLAEYMDGPATVRLLKPPPLDVPLSVVRVGEALELRNGGETVATARTATVTLSARAAPALESARRRGERYAGQDRHVFPTCFVCGVDRAEGDGLRIFAGPPEDHGDSNHHVACTWVPDPSLCDADGALRLRYAWAALDCPSGWAFLSFGPEIALLGEFTAEILEPMHCGREYIVSAWEIDREGRKRLTGSALYTAEGHPVARARATWITIGETR